MCLFFSIQYPAILLEIEWASDLKIIPIVCMNIVEVDVVWRKININSNKVGRMRSKMYEEISKIPNFCISACMIFSKEYCSLQVEKFELKILLYELQSRMSIVLALLLHIYISFFRVNCFCCCWSIK